MEVDHFNPTLTGARRNRYSNLMLATRLCNNFKQHSWPVAELRQKGIRFLNPTEEQDYGVQIFEDPQTHQLIGTTPAAKYHIDVLGLNDPSFIEERKDRAMLAKFTRAEKAFLVGAFDDLEAGLRQFQEMLEKMIPPIPPPPEEYP